MLAAVLKDSDELVPDEMPVPTPGPGEVVVHIRSCGFCATDSKAIKGIRRNVAFPLIAGHEPADVLSAVGPAVDHFREGDEVICQPSGYCGLCRHCRAGNTHYCEHAFTTGGDGPEDVWPGALAEHMKTKAACLSSKAVWTPASAPHRWQCFGRFGSCSAGWWTARRSFPTASPWRKFTGPSRSWVAASGTR